MKRSLAAIVLVCLFAPSSHAATLPAETVYQVNLTWTAPSSPNDLINGYNLYRAESGSSSYSLLNAGLIMATSFNDGTVAAGTSYQYYAASVDGEGNESVPSNTASVAIPFVPYPATVGTLTAN